VVDADGARSHYSLVALILLLVREDACSSSHYVTSSERVIGEWKRIWEEVVMA
jgi:hypothetical protein